MGKHPVVKLSAYERAINRFTDGTVKDADLAGELESAVRADAVIRRNLAAELARVAQERDMAIEAQEGLHRDCERTARHCDELIESSSIAKAAHMVATKRMLIIEKERDEACIALDIAKAQSSTMAKACAEEMFKREAMQKNLGVAREAERERCALVVESIGDDTRNHEVRGACYSAARTIRAL